MYDSASQLAKSEDGGSIDTRVLNNTWYLDQLGQAEGGRIMSENIELAATDVETTGLFPGGRDRIIEIAVVRTDSEGRVIREYSSLVNPERDVGASHIHGIQAKDVQHAPKFSEIAGDLLDILRNAVFVAHNASFDRRFVAAEMRRLGLDMGEWPSICTLDLARGSGVPAATRKLTCLCEYFQIPLDMHHAALDDARATSRLLHAILAACSQSAAEHVRRTIGNGVDRAFSGWPVLACSGKQLSRSLAKQIEEREPTLLEKLVRKLASVPEAGEHEERYLALLDRVLEDRLVTPEEEDQLATLARECGLTASQIQKSHERYLSDLLRVALRDGVLSELEKGDLEYVRRMLGVNNSDALRILKTAKEAAAREPGKEATALGGPRPVRGKTVCFTGDFRHCIKGEPVTREQAEAVAASHGMIVRKSVTKKLDYLVAADAATSSTKACKARTYGTRVIAEAVFWQMMDQQPHEG
jgi:DNA polymerase III subunit epsilon